MSDSQATSSTSSAGMASVALGAPAALPSWVRDPKPLSAREIANWEDFEADRCAEAGACNAAVIGTQLKLASLYRGFVRLFQFPLGPAAEIAFEPHRRAFASPLEPERALFDGLARDYGEAYRGSVVFNYLLALVAVLAAIAAMISPFPLPASIVEVLALAMILDVYLRGRARSRDNDSRGGARRFSQRWHERWLDYRGLAERFRYAELRGFVSAASVLPAPPPGEGTHEDWPTRYFRARMASAPRLEHTPREYADNLLCALDEQQRYHRCNAHLCHALSHHLHAVTGAVFVVAVVFAVLHLLQHLRPGEHGDGGGWLLVTAGLPALAAALHGIHGGCEYAKLARNSHDMEEALTELRVAAEDLVANDPNVDAGQDALERLISRFLHVSTDEASGWRAALWDKNVPLG